jgi:2-polyprenyl-3-methyl-5-hydroxy-6-metoxy-1,4-benzoquinol methylase
MSCKICDNTTGNKIHIVREMRVGSRDEFEYLECARCGCIQIVHPPRDLMKHYPPSYEPFQRERLEDDGFLSRMARTKRREYGLSGKGLVGRLIALIKPLPDFYAQFRKCRVALDSKILDVGCGGGQLLWTLHREGFPNLVGIDPYVPEQRIVEERGIKLIKTTIEGLPQKEPFDFIMMNHSFEHMPGPLAVLHALHKLLKTGHFLLIRIPVVAYAWREYGVNWVQLEAPRHFFLHSTRSMQMLAEKAGFKITEVFYDSTEHQFLGSEQYARDIAISDKNSYWVNPGNSIFTKEQVDSFKKKAQELNQKGDGDQAGFCLRRL